MSEQLQKFETGRTSSTGILAVREVAIHEQSAGNTTREQLLATFDSGYHAYNAVLSAKNGAGEAELLEPVSADVARQQLEAFLTPETMAAVEADLAKHAADETAGFDVIMVPNVAFTAAEETAVAEELQRMLGALPDSWSEASNANDAYHNASTAYVATNAEGGLRFSLAPRHANVPALDARAQQAWLHQQGTERLKSPADLEALSHIFILAASGALDDPETRFDRTYSRRFDDYREDEQGTPLSEGVANVGVHNDGQLSRGVSRAASGSNPGRAFIV